MSQRKRIEVESEEICGAMFTNPTDRSTLLSKMTFWLTESGRARTERNIPVPGWSFRIHQIEKGEEEMRGTDSHTLVEFVKIFSFVFSRERTTESNKTFSDAPSLVSSLSLSSSVPASLIVHMRWRLGQRMSCSDISPKNKKTKKKEYYIAKTKTKKKLYVNKAAFFPSHFQCVQEHEIRLVRISMSTVVPWDFNGHWVNGG